MDTLPRYGWDFSKVFFGWGVLCYEKRISNKGCITSTSVVCVVCFLIFLNKYDSYAAYAWPSTHGTNIIIIECQNVNHIYHIWMVPSTYSTAFLGIVHSPTLYHSCLKVLVAWAVWTSFFSCLINTSKESLQGNYAGLIIQQTSWFFL